MPARADPLDRFNARADAFLRIHQGPSVPLFISNVGCDVVPLRAGGLCMPVTLNAAGTRNAWITSPATTYGDYAAEELQRLPHRALTSPARALLRGVGHVLRHAGVDRAASINNWLVSTNTYPPLAPSAIRAVAAAARDAWPDRPLFFRSLNATHDGPWLHALQAAGAALLPSRQVYLFDDLPAASRARADLVKDLAWLRRSRLRWYAPGELDAAAYTRMAALYADLYIAKYSALNPQYTPALLAAWHASGLLRLAAVPGPDGALQGVVGTLRVGDVITSPIVGYDTSLPRTLGLYRLLAAAVLKQGLDEGCRVNLSAGVAHFKRQRGGVAAIEYSAVFAAHLPARARAALGVLGGLARAIGVPLMQRLEL